MKRSSYDAHLEIFLQGVILSRSDLRWAFTDRHISDGDSVNVDVVSVYH